METIEADILSEVRTPYPIGTAVRQRFESEGFVRLRSVLSRSAVRYFEPEITRKVIELNTMHLPMSQRSTYNKAFLQVSNLWRQSELIEQLTFSPRLAKIAADLMGVESVRLYHDQALYKEIGGGITPWHADQYYWPLSSDRSCTVWIPLQDTPDEMGPLEFAIGSHRFEFGRDLPISDESEEALQAALTAEDFEVSREPYEVGDVSFHQGWTFHRAGPNQSEIPRRVMTVIYLDAELTVTEPSNTHQSNDKRWFPGIEPGQIPDTPVTPVLHPVG